MNVPYTWALLPLEAFLNFTSIDQKCIKTSLGGEGMYTTLFLKSFHFRFYINSGSLGALNTFWEKQRQKENKSRNI